MTYKKTLQIGAIVLGVSLSTAYAIGRGGDVPSDKTPMEQIVAAATSSTEAAGVSWDLPVTRNARVDDWIDFLKGENYTKTARWLSRSTKYTPMIKDSLRARGMPEDLTYLAFIESGYNPNAASHAAAVGLWQFIKDTGRRYGMTVNEYVDERRDPFKSTTGALDYLQELYDRFGSWYLAAAAYNTGENRIARIMREETGSERGTDADFWRIAPRLPVETRNYVPLMLAAGHIGKEPAKYGFGDVDYQQALSFDTVHVPSDIPLAAVAKAVNVTDTIVYNLNPELVAKQTPPNKDWEVRVPQGSAMQFAGNFPSALHDIRLAQIQEHAKAKAAPKGSSVHLVKRGETLSGIAKRYGVTTRAIVRANGGLVPSQLQVGKKLRIPKKA